MLIVSDDSLASVNPRCYSMRLICRVWQYETSSFKQTHSPIQEGNQLDLRPQKLKEGQLRYGLSLGSRKIILTERVDLL